MCGGSTLSSDPGSLPSRQWRSVRSSSAPRPRSPPFVVNDSRRARQARSLRLTAVRARRFERFALRTPLTNGRVSGSDPGRFRPMSATHDSVFKMGTRSPGTLLCAFPRASVARGITPLSQPRRARPLCGRRCLPSAACSRVPSMLRRPRVSRQNAHGSNDPRWVRPPALPRVPPSPKRARVGVPPDGLDLRHRVA